MNYLNVPWDLTVQIAGAKLVRKVMATPPLSLLRINETFPGETKVPNDANGGKDADWSKWILSKFNAVSHPIGTTAMMRRR